MPEFLDETGKIRFGTKLTSLADAILLKMKSSRTKSKMQSSPVILGVDVEIFGVDLKIFEILDGTLGVDNSIFEVNVSTFTFGVD
uniref:Phage tail protein n=1 Tax=Strongyloides stercoralis TaxID=6248 RepID=A0A0K0EAY6_STRER